MKREVLMFVAGICIGTLVTGTVMRYKYAQDLEREVDSVIAEFSSNPRVVFKDISEAPAKTEVEEINVFDMHTDEELAARNEEIDKLASYYYYPPNEVPDVEKKMFDCEGREHIVDEHGVNHILDEDGNYVSEDGDYNPAEDYDGDDPKPLTDADMFLYEEGYVGKEQMGTTMEPFTITSDELNTLMEEEEDYTVCFWTIYNSNGGAKVMANDLEELVTPEEIEDTVGIDIYNKIGEYEPSVAIVRNNRLRCVIEITEDARNYSDVIKAMPFINQ